ncbi:MAG: histidine kinase [Mycobacterium sp.]|nr:histidine kinase [Mycobacterium sp.]
MDVDGSSFDGTNVYVDPTVFYGVAARMLAAGGRDSVPTVLMLLGQALRADVSLQESGPTRSAIPLPRLRRAAEDIVGLDVPAPIELPISSHGVVLAMLTIEASPQGLPTAWTVSPGPLSTIADLLALVLASGGGPQQDAEKQTSHAWLELDEADRADTAGELHDGLVQSLVAARYLLDLASTTWPDGPMPWLEAVREGLSAALADGRALLNSVQPRTRKGRSIRAAIEELSGSYRVPVQLLVTEGAAEPYSPPTPMVNAAAYRFVQAALADLVMRGADAAELRLTTGPGGLSIDVSAVGERPAWPDESGEAMQRWATRIELLGGTALLQPASAHLRFGPADEDHEPLTQEAHAWRTK